MKKRKLIGTCIDDNYLWPWVVMVYSAVSNSKNQDFDIVIANMDGMLSTESKLVISDLSKLLKIESRVIDFTSNLQVDFQHNFNMTTFGRLFLMDFLDQDFLWLDADLLLMPEWDQIFSEKGYLESSDVVIHGVLDSVSTLKRLEMSRNPAFLASNGRYINAGVMKVNIQRWRELSSKLSWRRMAQEVQDDGLHFFDQDLINLLCAGKISLLRQGYNYLAGDEITFREKVFVQHYAGDPKPWRLTKSGKEILLGIQGFQYFSPKNWVSNFNNSLILHPIYWGVEREIEEFLEALSPSLIGRLKTLRQRGYLKNDWRLKLKYVFTKLITRRFFN